MKRIIFADPKNDVVETVTLLVLDQLISNGDKIGECKLIDNIYYIEQLEEGYISNPKYMIPDYLYVSERRLTARECYKNWLRLNFLCHSVKDLHYIYVYEQIGH